MFAKFSVRKPFTVLVGVILIIVLGVVSFMNTTTDLIPSMNLPYAVVFTTYFGATPEQVEMEITSPIESRMGTVSGISSISSTSSEHMSVIILEFTDTTNMDAASLEIRESLDMLSFPENAGKPTILRLNPDMMPIMVTSVYAEGLDLSGLSEFTKNTVVPAFEGIPGVASVSPSGLIHNQLMIEIDEEKIAQVNENLQASIMSAMAEIAEQMQAEFMAQMALLPPEEAMAMMEAMENTDHDEHDFNPEDVAIPAEMLTIEVIKMVLTAQNFAMPAGMIEIDGEDFMVRVTDRFRTVEEVQELLIFDITPMIAEFMPGLELEPVRLSHIANVFATNNEDTEYTRVNGNPAVMITMQKQTEFSTADLTREIREKMHELSERHDDIGLEFAILMDQGHYIDVIVGSILNNIIIGGILALLLLMLFLFDIRPTLVVGLSIPVSLMLAFTAMYFSGVSLNIISMSGLALSVGMLIDNSIVVIDNIYRLRADGVPVRRAAVQGAREVSGAIIACTLTTIAVFLPIVFTQGLTRQLFTDLGLTIAYALLASLLVALTVVPASSSAVFYKMKPKQNKAFNRFRDGYAKLLAGSLKIKWAVLILPLILLITSGYVVYSRGMEFFPAMDAEEIMVSVSLPEGTTFDDAVLIAEELSAHIEKIADIEHVGIDISGGGGAMMNVLGGMVGLGGAIGGSNIAIDIYLLMIDDRTMNNTEIAEIIMEKDGYMDAELFVTYNSQQTEMGFLTGDGISIRITGRELDDLRDTAIAIADVIRDVPGAINITDFAQRGAPELRIRVDKDSASRYNLTVAQVFMAAMETISNPEEKLNMTLSGLDYEVVISDVSWTPADREAIENLEISNPAGDIIRISEIAEIYDSTGFTTIRRQDGARFVTVRGEIAEDANVTLVNDEIRRRLDNFETIGDTRIVIGGESEAIGEAFADLYLMLALALMFIYLIMVAQFQSLLSPFIVMFTIPLAFTGGFAGLLIGGMSLSIVSMIGLILLAGVIVSNGIVFVDCVNRLRRGGLAKKDALIEAGRIRLRPILMTALTTIAAMSTMTIGMGMGTEMVQPMAVTVVGGLLYATLMTLFVVPCMYDLLHRNRDMTKDEDLDYEKEADKT